MSHTLKLDNEFLIDEVCLYGIISDLPSYRLCFFINEALDLKLVRCTHDWEYLYKGKEKMSYDQYFYVEKDMDISWKLTANKNPMAKNADEELSKISGLPLIPSLKMMDYFLWFEGGASKKFIKKQHQKLNEIAHIRSVQILDLSSVKNIDNLLLQ